MSRILAALVLALAICGVGSLGACGTLERISAVSEPPGHYHRPALVRGLARTGSYAGATVGIVAWVVFWPVTKGISLVVDEPFGYSPEEFSFIPLTACTAAGHHLLGLPGEAIYQVGYGLWVDRPPPPAFEDVGGAK